MDFSENCHPSSRLNGYKIANNIRTFALRFGTLTRFNAYLDVSLESPRSMALLSQLQASGLSVVHCPHHSRKDVADRALVADMLAFAFSAPITVVIISGDDDFTNAIVVLKSLGHRVVLIAPKTSSRLKRFVDVRVNWEDVLCLNLKWPKQPKRLGRLVEPLIPGQFETLVAVLHKGDYLDGNVVQFIKLARMLRMVDPGYHKGHGGARKYIQKARDFGIVDVFGDEDKSDFKVTLSRGVTDPAVPTAPGIAAEFAVLVEILQVLRSKGDVRPVFSTLGTLVLKRDPNAYSRAGCTKLKSYVELARKANLVNVGPDWVELNFL